MIANVSLRLLCPDLPPPLPQSPMGRAAQPAELAPSYVFLASQESSYITADVIAVTGGSPIV